MRREAGVIKCTNKSARARKQQPLELSISLGLLRPEPKSREKLLPRGHCPRVTFVTMPRTCRQNMSSDTHVIYQGGNAGNNSNSLAVSGVKQVP